MKPGPEGHFKTIISNLRFIKKSISLLKIDKNIFSVNLSKIVSLITPPQTFPPYPAPYVEYFFYQNILCKIV